VIAARVLVRIFFPHCQEAGQHKQAI